MVLGSRKGCASEAALDKWLDRHARTSVVTEEKLRAGDLLPEIRRVLAGPAPTAPSPSGVAEAVVTLSNLLS
jgi:hypothetical protein